MPLLTAAECRAKYAQEILVDLSDGGQFKCRRPDFRTQIEEGLLPMPLVRRAAADLQLGTPADDPVALDRTAATREFLHRWVCLACLQPRVVMTREELTSDSVCVEDLPYPVKDAIVKATLRLRPAGGTAASEEFRGLEHGAADRPAAAPVAGDAAVAAAGD